MAVGEVIIRFNNVSFWFNPVKPLLDEAGFSIRRGSKITLMGQNGGGKTTIFRLILGELETESGDVVINETLSIAIARQIIPKDETGLTLRDFFVKMFKTKVYDLDPRIKEVLNVVNLNAGLEKKIGTFSGGEQARLLLASALIQKPDILLLDEPTNNLDKTSIDHLKTFLKNYTKTVLVISHDAEFLNTFTEGVLYLDVHTKKIEQYIGNYLDVVTDIKQRIERERRENVRRGKEIEHRKEQANFFAQKGGHMRDVARKMREKIETLEEDAPVMREEDKTIRSFIIPSQTDTSGDILSVKSVSVVKDGKPVTKKTVISLKKGEHLLIEGRNGIGKSTLMASIATGQGKGIIIQPGTRIGYYRQDFAGLDFAATVYETLSAAAAGYTVETMRSIAAGFLITSELLKAHVGDLSEGQKGLLQLAVLVLQKPGLLLMDEPTNHMNFRHIPVIAEALDKYDGALVLISHVPEFFRSIKIHHTLNLETL